MITLELDNDEAIVLSRKMGDTKMTSADEAMLRQLVLKINQALEGPQEPAKPKRGRPTGSRNGKTVTMDNPLSPPFDPPLTLPLGHAAMPKPFAPAGSLYVTQEDGSVVSK